MIMLSILLAVAGTSAIAVFDYQERFEIEESVQVSAVEAWTDWSYAAIDPSGSKLALIIPSRQEVVCVLLRNGNATGLALHAESGDHVSHFTTSDIESFDPGTMVRALASRGRGRSEVSLPLAVSYDAQGRLIISDSGNRRILIFGPDGSFESSFLLTGPTAAPNEIRLLPNGNILASGLNLDSTSRINAGNYCTVYSHDGEILRVFSYTPQVAFDSTLWIGVSSLIDLDESGNIYQVFSVEGRIRVYDSLGKLKRTIDYTPSWFYAPKAMEVPLVTLHDEPEGFWTSWPRIIKLIYAGSDRLILIGEANDRLAKSGKRFVYDIVTLTGDVLHSTVFSDELPIGIDRNGFVYSLSLTGDQICRLRFVDGTPDEK